MCKKRGDFGWKSYEETQRIGAGFAEMCNERGGALRKSLRDGSCVFGENYWYCGEKSVSLRAEQITYHKTMNQTILKRYIAIFLFIATAAVNGWAATLTNRSLHRLTVASSGTPSQQAIQSQPSTSVTDRIKTVRHIT